ncbi:hypothetical protein ACH0BU_17805 [Sphingomonas olei]
MPSRTAIIARIDDLAISADAKHWLKHALDVSAEVGTRVVAIGREIVARILEFARAFPATTFGVIVGFTMGALIGSIPVVGLLLGPMVTPLLVALGLGTGAIADVKDGGLRARVTELERSVAAKLA